MANLFRSILLRLQNKSVPATTSDNPVTADNGYDGLGTVTITPQQHSETYTPSANTAANDMGAVHNKRYVNTSGMIVPSGNKAITANGTGIDVSSYATASVSVTGTSVTPSASGTYFASGLNNMATAGYAYSSQPQPTETALWTNSNPAAAFTAQGINTSQSVTNFDAIKVVYKPYYSVDVTSEIIYPIATFNQAGATSDFTNRCALSGTYFGGRVYNYLRLFYKDTNTRIYFGTAYQDGSSSSNNSYCIPKQIIGIKY